MTAQASGASRADRGCLDTALSLARLGPAADPNPRVGAVVVDAAGQVAGLGWHRGSGHAHAEVAAVAAARAGGRDLAGGTAYVTLEPCNHTGRTGPCSEALIHAGLARVVYLAADPGVDSGGGAAAQRAAGLCGHQCLEPDLARRAADLNRAWEHAITRGRPFVTWKFAATLDGRSAAADGTSAWITAPAARADVHRRRAACGAVLVGTGTVLADDPRLTVRDEADVPLPQAEQPLRVVAGQRDLPAAARVLDDAAPTLHLRTRDPHEVLAHLHARRVRHVWLEGGPTLAAAFLRAGLIDEALAYLAPALLGAGPPAVGDLGIGSMPDIRRLTLTDVARIGPDVRLTLHPLPPKEA